MAKITKLIKQNDGTYEIKIPEEYVSKFGWRNGHVLKIDADDDKIVIGAGYKTDDKGNATIPTLPYLDEKQRECIQYMSFTNYATGEKYPNSTDTILY